MNTILPTAKPRLTTNDLTLLMLRAGLNIADIRAAHPLLVAGVRGYYRDTMGERGKNDRMIYDDAICLITPNVFAAYNGNTDPNGFRKGIATLNPGLWPVYRFDLHSGKYLAICQRAGAVTVTRDGTPPRQDTGEFGINIHKGSNNSTSSLGCQTIPPSQWDGFINIATSEAKRLFGGKWKQRTVAYVLLEA
jgi:hypothetical protein